MKTSTPKATAPDWYVVDAAGKTLGRLAAGIAHVLNGKHKEVYSPHQVMSDHVIVLNAEKVILTGKKPEQKEYVRHSGYLGHVKRTPFARLFAAKPTAVIARAVRGMLPRNKLRTLKMQHLHIFIGTEHPHEAQKPQPFPDTKLKAQDA